MKNFSAAEDFILNNLKSGLNANLTYHGVHHTLDVLDSAVQIAVAEKVTSNEIALLRIGVLMHDYGFLITYKDHEEEGCRLANEILPQFGFEKKDIEIIERMIMSTKIPQSTYTLIEKIICDADLDYLGRDDYYSIAETLFEEMKIHSGLTDKTEWNHIQLQFLKSHHYHTAYSRMLRETNKQKRITELEKITAA